MLSFLFTGFNVETVEYKNISFTVWDVGGQDKVGCYELQYLHFPVMLVVLQSGRRVTQQVHASADPAVVEALLPEHPGTHLRGGQQRS